jgi:glucokinase
VPCIRRVILLNDFVAAGLGVLVLGPDDVVPLSTVGAMARQPKVCVGAGTGLGEVRSVCAQNSPRFFHLHSIKTASRATSRLNSHAPDPRPRFT